MAGESNGDAVAWLKVFWTSPRSLSLPPPLRTMQKYFGPARPQVPAAPPPPQTARTALGGDEADAGAGAEVPVLEELRGEEHGRDGAHLEHLHLLGGGG